MDKTEDFKNPLPNPLPDLEPQISHCHASWKHWQQAESVLQKGHDKQKRQLADSTLLMSFKYEVQMQGKKKDLH